ncbi:hypothetical protein [Mesorhizobium sp. M1396]
MIEVKGNGCMVEQLPLPFLLPSSCERAAGSNRVLAARPYAVAMNSIAFP